MAYNLAYRILLIAAALLAVSCSKEYMEEQEAKKEAAQKEKVSNYWSVVGKLVSAEDRTDDYAGKTFEPVIGIEDPSDPQTRIVSTNDLESARERFANLIGVEVSKIGSSYTYKDSEVGTLVYTEGGGNSLATVEVNIKEIPHLSKIRYATPEQKGENGKFDGAAYYRFGDVISIQAKDGRKEYWLCVRPAFGKEGKETTHWITVSPVGTANVLNYSAKKSSNKREYNIQDELKYDSEHLQNLAELLYAICFPDEWHKNVTDIPKMKMFHDFSKDLIRYHNEAFWTNVQNAWERLQVSEKVFGKPLSYFAGTLQDSGLYLLYGDSSWNTWFYNGPTVAQVHYSNTKGGVSANMHTVAWSKVQHDVINKKDPSQDLDYNVLTECTAAKPYLEKSGFFGDANPRWIVRYAEGCELSSSGKYGDNDVRSPIPGSTEVYRYYKDVLPTEDLANSELYPEVSKTKTVSEFNGKPHYFFGDILEDQNNYRWLVVNQAGNSWEKSPYALAVSFEGFQYTSDGKAATNLPKRDQAIMATFWLEMFFNQVTPKKTGRETWEGHMALYGSPLYNTIDYLNLEPRILFQRILAQNGNEREDTHAASIAYNDNSGKQRLLRWITNNQNELEMYYWYLWDHYVTTPDRTTQKYAPEAYSNTPIYLEDIADQTKIRAYAPDSYAVQPLSLQDGMVKKTHATSREGRTETDEAGKKAANCVYNKNTWDSRAFVSDMWLEPVLMFRVARIYDRGESDFDALSEDGTLSFKRIAKHDWGEASLDALTNYRVGTSSIQGLNLAPEYWFLDGRTFTFPTWKTF